ncbi:17701_t:CDS:2, partial [Dentiscutata erythropus]
MLYFKATSRIHTLRICHHYTETYSISKVIFQFPTRLLSHQRKRTVPSRRNDMNFQDRLQEPEELKITFDKGLIYVERCNEAKYNFFKFFTRKVPESEEYKDPLQLLSTNGADWGSQEAPTLHKILKRALTRFFYVYEKSASNLLKFFKRGLFPYILEYKGPLRLLSTSGADWDFQEAPDLREILKRSLTRFFYAYKKGNRGKKSTPLFTIMGGAGIGKSRLLMELPQVTQSVVGNEELKKRLD